MKLIIFILMLSLASIAGASEGHKGHHAKGHHAKGHHHDSTPGPVGPIGPVGPQGLAGTNGTSGSGFDLETKYVAGIGARVYDHRIFSVDVFDDYDLRAGRNDTFGTRINFKIGKSYEEREIEKLKVLISELRRIPKLDIEVVPIKHHHH